MPHVAARQAPVRREARAGAAPHAAAPAGLDAARPSRLPSVCACGGGCPRCTRRRWLQPKLAVGAAHDPLEREADRVAEAVLQTPAASRPVLSRPAALAASARVPPSVDAVLAEPGQALATTWRDDLERRFGQDFSSVRIHTGASAERSAREVGALAYTVGQRLVFGAGQFAPQTPQGRQLLAHELAHSIQQQGSTLLQRRVTPTPVARRDRLALIGDGTPANPGITIGELTPYVAAQADWFSEPTLTPADRDMVWNMLRDLDSNAPLRSAARGLHLAEVATMTPADRMLLDTYATGFDPAAQTVRLSTPVTTLTDARNKGAALRDLTVFVPAPVLRVVIPESGLDYLVAQSKVPELQTYYQQFHPTLEHPDEWPHVEALLTATLAPMAPLQTWIADLHVFSSATRSRLITNVGDTTRSRPVLLVLFSATDWNSAFLQAANMEAAVLNAHNLTLMVQGAPSLAALTVRVNDIANRYGERDVIGFDLSTFSVRYGPGRIGQVVFAGHGTDTSVEMAISSTAPVNEDDQWVRYQGESVDSATNTANTQLLIDTVLRRMDPTAARIVFAGCLVGSHEFPASMNLSNLPTAAATLRTHLAGSANLRDFVNARMATLGIVGTTQAALGSTPFSSFNVEASGAARLSQPDDPAIGGTPAQYVQQGSEPEGALRAALETYADTAIGPSTTSGWMRARVTALTGDIHWYRTQTRSAFQLALPPAGDVNPATVLDLSHRVEPWLLAGWASTVDISRLASAVHAGEEPTVYGGMLASEMRGQAHLPIAVQQAWMAADARQLPTFAAALDASPLTRTNFQPLLNRTIVDPRLATLLSTGSPPTRGQLMLALTVAVDDGPVMPTDVRNFLRSAAGGAATSAFPAGLGVGALLDGADELQVLQDIGLAPGAAATPSGSTAAPPDRANVDLDRDSTNERFVTIARREAAVTAVALNIRARPALSARVLGIVTLGTVVRVMGFSGTWSLIDANGRVGFVSTFHLTP